MEAVAEYGQDEWIAVDDVSAPGRVRHAAQHRARRLGFSDHRTGEVAIAATELATNLHRHAEQGAMLVRIRRGGEAAAVELVAVDHGPGVADLPALVRDGRSTAGTLGIGLGAVVRLSTWFDAHSVPGRGTVMVATFWAGPAPVEPPSIGGITRPMTGEAACGDSWAKRVDESVRTMLLVDGLGHGELAAAAAREAIRAFLAQDSVHDLSVAMQGLEAALRHTRGAAVAMTQLREDEGTLRFAGVGNVAAWYDDGERRRGLHSTPGIVGNGGKRVRVVDAPLQRGSLVVMHSDGLTAKWDLDRYPGVRGRGPDVIAATLLRDAAIRHDDASVVVGKVR